MFSKIAVAALAGLATAAPAKRQTTIAVPAGVNDGVILNYALTLEHLEDTFYREGLKNYTQQQFADAGFDATFYNNLKEISYDETSHVSFLTKALQSVGVAPVEQCTYAFPSSDVKSFVAVSQILEGVGVTAYLGAAKYIADKTYLTAAGSILTVESRHSAYIRASMKQAPFPQPFDAPQTFDEVYSLAAPFIKSCPQGNPTLPFKAFPALALGTTGPIKTGQEITISTPGYDLESQSGTIYAAWAAVTGPVFMPTTKVDGGFKTTVPKGFAGQSYLVLTACNDTLSDDTTAAGPAIVEITGAVGMEM